MNFENLYYTLAQVIHNFGACALVGASVIAYWPVLQMSGLHKKLAWALFVGWIIQGMSGTGFGAISYLVTGAK